MIVFIVLACFAAITNATYLSSCGYESCFFSTELPTQYRPAATKFCSYLIDGRHCPTTTVTTTTLSVSTITPTAATSRLTVVIDPLPVTSTKTLTVTTCVVSTRTVTATTTLSASTVTAPAATFVNYPSRARPIVTRRGELVGRYGPPMPSVFTQGCSDEYPTIAKLKSACSCFLPCTTVTITRTSTRSITVIASPSLIIITVTLRPAPPTTTTTVTSTFSSTSFATVTTTSTTVAVLRTVTAAGQCGTSFTTRPTASTSGAITCANTVPSPSSNARHRIEGNDSEGTIFEDCIIAGPRYITPTGGETHLCDGTNNNANPSPGTTVTDQLDAASQLYSFPYQGTWSAQYQDYFISSISSSTQTSDQYWGSLVNGQYTPTGGCQFEVQNGDRSLWAFDAFNKNVFLQIQPDFAVATAGRGSVQVTVTDAMAGNNIQGAAIAGQTTNVNGQATIPVPVVPGCYQYKATITNGLRSNAFYLNVVSSF